jgi:dihydrodipicolinate synthase/N-acetylneuraminate lyase
VPFYVYEFERASGYAVSRHVLDGLRDAAPNLAGMKVSDSPYEKFARYLDLGLDVFVGPEAFIGRGTEAGAVGAVSALASAFPERVVAAVRDRSDELASLRESIERFPRHAALKHVVTRRGVPVRPEVRPPLRLLTQEEERDLDAALAA